MKQSAPLVSVVTPVYNGGKYLADCIESVLRQRYENWDYTIVNNCSTDDTLEIAEDYARRDNRIRIISNDRFVSAIENHNIAFRQISSDSKYCKLVSADDWLYPECIEQLVRLAEAEPSVGVVQSYPINIKEVRWSGLPVTCSVFDGHEIGRLYLLERVYLTAPSANLYRSTLVRSGKSFFPGSRESADVEACLRCLQHSDFGVVHQILSFERIHDGSVTRKSVSDSYLLDRLALLLEYGPVFLSQDEMSQRLEDALEYYYGVLATAIVNARGGRYWKYHKERLTELGFRFYSSRLGRALLFKLGDLVLNPKQTLEKGLRRVAHSA